MGVASSHLTDRAVHLQAKSLLLPFHLGYAPTGKTDRVRTRGVLCKHKLSKTNNMANYANSLNKPMNNKREQSL